ncbi:hypothetical protein SDRG_06091 [Saprolegnia diclina VS20]|uniref:Uncharacterized protein n=1 Tax=Saprolegnia diclina (strain VS20) TaxID=1156394 RepID=T0QFD8_SAPDV|nr:hypothetical protein SDRG_06091 [Saprolegnia diclina VS20]EQC36654.1 hypothetical protein SDRG_06091 [Saprolegnia diclina VS20]|eukprot:XP_008610075.1 hypothetical protein SDRG_06091 [Saprolegnia diclina VS20]
MPDEPTCYMCWESADLMASPCACTTHVHRACLAQWQLTSSRHDATTHCPTCRTPFHTTRFERVILRPAIASLQSITCVSISAVAFTTIAGVALVAAQMDACVGARLATAVFGTPVKGFRAAFLYVACSLSLVAALIGYILVSLLPATLLWHSTVTLGAGSVTTLAYVGWRDRQASIQKAPTEVKTPARI